MKKEILGHLERVKQQPHHVRRDLVVTTAASISIFIGIVWLIGNIVTGAFAIHADSFAALTGGNLIATTSAAGPAGQFAGAAAAIPGVTTPAKIEVVDTTPPPSTQPKAEKTVIPF